MRCFMVTGTPHKGQMALSPPPCALRDPWSRPQLRSGCSFQLFHHQVENRPVRLPHHREIVLQFLNSPGPLYLQVQLPLKIRPRELQVELVGWPVAQWCSNPVIHVSCLPSNVDEVGLQSHHWSCHYHPRIGRSSQPLPGDGPCSLQIS